MKSIRYIDNVTSLSVDEEKCVGCSMCINVCPHQVFSVEQNKVKLLDRDGCMECGACALNCPVDAISVTPGVGCASLIINRWLRRNTISTGDCC